jgi:hypothetical protein
MVSFSYGCTVLILTATDYIKTLPLDSQYEFPLRKAPAQSCTKLLELIWSTFTISQILSVANDIAEHLYDSTSDDSQDYSVNLTATTTLLSRIELGPDRKINWPGMDKHGFWSIAHLLIVLISLATVPQYCSPLEKAQLRQILYIEPRNVFEKSLELRDRLGTSLIAGSMINLVKKTKKALRQTAHEYLSHSRWGRGMAMIFRVSFKIAQEGSKIKELSDTDDLLYSIYIHVDGTIDFEPVEIDDSVHGMSPESIHRCVRQLLTRSMKMPPEYRNALVSLDFSALRKSMDEAEGRNTFNLLIMNFALLYSQHHILDEAEIEYAKVFKQALALHGSSSSGLSPNILQLLTRILEDTARPEDLIGLVGAVTALVIMGEAK